MSRHFQILFSRSHVRPSGFAVRSEKLLNEVDLKESGSDDDEALSHRPERHMNVTDKRRTQG